VYRLYLLSADPDPSHCMFHDFSTAFLTRKIFYTDPDPDPSYPSSAIIINLTNIFSTPYYREKKTCSSNPIKCTGSMSLFL
jgi:hypothetical protein